MSIERKDRILEVHPVTVLHDFVETNKFREREREREIERERESERRKTNFNHFENFC